MGKLSEILASVEGLVVVAYVLAVIAPTLEAMPTCDMSSGYNPYGTPASETHPSGTWAGTCKSIKDTVLVVPRVLNVLFAPYLP